MSGRIPRRRAPSYHAGQTPLTDRGSKSLPIAEYEAAYGAVGEFHRVEGGVVEFVLESPGQARFIRVTKDGKTYKSLRWPNG